jgi:hypothetical protein
MPRSQHDHVTTGEVLAGLRTMDFRYKFTIMIDNEEKVFVPDDGKGSWTRDSIETVDVYDMEMSLSVTIIPKKYKDTKNDAVLVTESNKKRECIISVTI